MSKSGSTPESQNQRHLEHLSLVDLQLYIDGELSPDARGQVEAHLEHCEQCRSKVDTASAFGELLQSVFRSPAPFESDAVDEQERLGSSACPDDLDLAAYTEGRLSGAERIRVEAHVSRCRDCLAILSSTVRAAAAEDATKPITGLSERLVCVSLKEVREARADALLSKLWELVHSTRGDIRQHLRGLGDGIARGFREAFTYPTPVFGSARVDDDLIVVSPFGKVRSRIAFVWEPWGEADSYEVSISDSDWVQRTTRCRIVIDRDDHAWATAGNHEWILKAFRGSTLVASVSTSFSVAGEQEEQCIGALEQSIGEIEPEVDRLAIWGGILEQCGFCDEAVASYQRSHHLRPAAGLAYCIARCFNQSGLTPLRKLWNDRIIELDRAVAEGTVEKR